MNDCLEHIVKSIDQLPPFPEAVLRVLEIAEDPDASAGDIVALIQYDPATTANCLKLCNSSYFGLREKVTSIQHAVVLLGTDTLVKLVIADCCRLSAFARGQQGYGLRPGELWRHSLASAMISQVLARRLAYDDFHGLYTAALLHDIGKLVIDHFIADNFDAMFRLMQDKGYGMVEAEKAYFGIDHAEVGGFIAEAWRFPSSLVRGIRTHHLLSAESSAKDGGALIALSNLVSHLFCDDQALNRRSHMTCGIDGKILKAFGLSPEDLDDIGNEALSELNRAGELLNVPVKKPEPSGVH